MDKNFLWGGALAANQCEGAYLEDGRLPSSCDLLPDAANGRWNAMYHPKKLLETGYDFYPSHEAMTSITDTEKTSDCFPNAA